MDNFFSEIYAPIIFKWLSFQESSDGIKISTIYNNEMYQTILFDMTDYKGTMTLWAKGIIEEQIINKTTLHSVFYLHYQFQNIPHFMKMYREFYDSLVKHAREKTIRIGLCCSGGFTATTMAQMSNEAIHLSDLPFHVEPLAFYQLEEKINDYQLIYLAPQIHHKFFSVQDKHIIKLDPLIYATRDIYKFIKDIEKRAHE
ncbi:Phosphotransferase system cellobiose-specific component IIB [Kandleria vitulina]|uniref:Phosphotransferase system cellobiose-specific component IIB n=1 Tax=Kandleria vitulina TaxID=1630 RepID=A0A1H2QKX5_9FIRM|nr:hypothetical protein [Kandleria vitulina]SDW07801.1 Phosphotransferase system cellobiose-specific component IIB [Kandleria vitulina]HAD23161.1 hypothetical protein [Kandleria vitulina]HCY53417.1 hypothetical protein [Kandleria vitulina]